MKNAKDYIWAFIGKIAPQAVYLLATIILARVLTPDDFGKVGILAIFISIATTLNDAGLSGSLIKEKDISSIDCSTINIFNICVSTFLYIILFVASPLIEKFFATPQLSSIARCLGLVFLINSISTVPKALMIRQFEFKWLTYISLISIICGAFLSIVSAYSGAGAYSLVIYQIAIAVTTSILIVIKSHYKFSLIFSISSFKKLFSFGFFTTACNIVDNIYENILSFLFGKFLSISQVGYFSQSKKLENVSVYAGKETLNNVAFPVLTRLKEEKDLFVSESFLLVRNIILLCLPIFIIVIIFSKEIIIIFFGTKWIEAAFYLSQLMIAGFFMLIEGAIRSFIKAFGNVAQLLLYTLFKRLFAISIIIATAFIKADYMIYAYIIGSFLGLFANIFLYTKLLNIPRVSYLSNLFKLSLPSIICFAPIFAIYITTNSAYYSLIIALVITYLYYFVVLKHYDINIFSSLKNLILKK